MAAVSVVAVAIGAVAARSEPLAVACGVLFALAVCSAWLRGRTTWVVFVAALGGVTVLGYGFANVPAFPSAPVPLVDVLLVGTFAALVVTGAGWPSPRVPFLIAAFLFGLGVDPARRGLPDLGLVRVARLHDVRRALRVVRRVLAHEARRPGTVATCALVDLSRVVVYGLTQFHGGAYSTHNLVVGLQRPVALLGHATGVASVSAFFFFALLRPFGSRSLILAALAIAPLFVFQSRGLYLAVPLTVLVLALQRARTPGMRRLSAAAVFAVAAAAIVLVVQPTGRFGSTSPALFQEQLATLVGGTGVGHGSLTARTQWFWETIDRVDAHPGALVFGLGLGPDLASGFSADGVLLVRKPHDDFLEAFARLGLVGFTALTLLIGTALKALVAGGRQLATPRERLFVQWVLANSIIYLFISATQPLLAYPFGTIPLFGILGAGLALGRTSGGVET